MVVRIRQPRITKETIDIYPPPAVIAGQFQQFGLDIRSYRVPFNRVIDTVVVPSVRRNFETQSSAGNKWAPLSPFTKDMRKFPDKPILQQYGNLRKSAASRTPWVIDSRPAIGQGAISADFSKIKGAGGYALKQQLGDAGGNQYKKRNKKGKGYLSAVSRSGETPARPFIELTTTDAAKVEAVFETWIAERAVRAGVVTV